MAQAQASSRLLTVSILIPAHNEGEAVGLLVRACWDQVQPIEQVIVVADACTDDTAGIAERAGATVIVTDFKDKAAAQNAAMSHIHSDIIIGFDGDTLPDADCIWRMVKSIKEGADATCASILPIQEEGFWISARRFSYSLSRRWWRLCQSEVGRMQVLTGAAYAFKTEAIKAVGGFPEGLISADMDATWALHQAGYKLTYTSKAVAFTNDPETYKVYKNQMRRWSSGYFQNMAKYKRQLLHPRSILVVGTAIFDLLGLFWLYGFVIFSAVTDRPLLWQTYLIWLVVHAIIITGLVATVIGPKKAIKGFIPYTIVNYYNKWLYLCAFGREWILGRHYTSWTGRQGRATVITPMTTKRKITLAAISAVVVVGLVLKYLFTGV